MPRKLLRVALVAAVIPALTPVISSAQTTRPNSTVRTAASTPAPKQGTLSLWQRLRGQKPAVATSTPRPGVARLVRVSDERPVATATTPSDQAIQLEGSSDMQLLRSRSNRVRPSFEQLQAPEAAAPVIQPQQPTRDDFENPFPEDVPTAGRGRQAPQVQQDVATPVEAPAEASPFESEQLPTEPEAFPIDSAAPPQDVTAEYNAPQGYAPRFNRTGMMTPDAQANDVTFANPIPGRPISTAMNGMNGAIPANPVPGPYPGPVGIARIDGAMYPAPLPGIPFDVGTTMITNPALDPHEMLYAHRYRGLYGPFYHKTYRHWFMTPFGICKSEKRVLVGTEVRVNYKSHISPFSLFFPPVTH